MMLHPWDCANTTVARVKLPLSVNVVSPVNKTSTRISAGLPLHRWVRCGCSHRVQGRLGLAPQEFHRQGIGLGIRREVIDRPRTCPKDVRVRFATSRLGVTSFDECQDCLLYTSPSPR